MSRGNGLDISLLEVYKGQCRDSTLYKTLHSSILWTSSHPVSLFLPTFRSKMVRTASLSLALAALGLFNLVTAAPSSSAPLQVVRERDTPESTTTGERFSFAKWVDDIIANPETALTPDQAMQAFEESLNGTVVARDSIVEKRWDALVKCSSTGVPAAVVSFLSFHFIGVLKTTERCTPCLYRLFD